MPKAAVHLLDYGAGNVRSICNAIEAAGFDVVFVRTPADLAEATALVFPGVGAFGSAMTFLREGGFVEPLRAYIRSGRPYMGVCLGLQTLFESSEESPGESGLGIIPGAVTLFPAGADAVPHIGWNELRMDRPCAALAGVAAGDRVYFVHSYRATPAPENASWVAATTDYAGSPFIAAVQLGAVFATQFHPEKSGAIGLDVFQRFLQRAVEGSGGSGGGGGDFSVSQPIPVGAAAGNADNSSSVSLGSSNISSCAAISTPQQQQPTRLARRVVACLDVRENDEGDLVVTKGDKYDVRDAAAATPAAAGGVPGSRPVRNLGKPVELAARYYDEGADEVAFLNITAFRGEPLDDAPMLSVLEAASSRVFVPLTIGGGIRSYTDGSGKTWSALDVASRYFRAGADKVSIGSDAVYAAQEYYARGGRAGGGSAIEEIARVYGRQAVVVSLDPRRVYVGEGAEADAARTAGHTLLRVVAADSSISNAEAGRLCWYECTVKGGREGSGLDARSLAIAVEALGAGELLVNCVDCDGQKAGFDEALMGDLAAAVRIPIIASSGAGVPAHFVSVFEHTRVEAALAAGIFHRREVAIADVKREMAAAGLPVRQAALVGGGAQGPGE